MAPEAVVEAVDVALEPELPPPPHAASNVPSPVTPAAPLRKVAREINDSIVSERSGDSSPAVILSPPGYVAGHDPICKQNVAYTPTAMTLSHGEKAPGGFAARWYDRRPAWRPRWQLLRSAADRVRRTCGGRRAARF